MNTREIKIHLTTALNAAGINATKQQLDTLASSVSSSMGKANKSMVKGWADFKAGADLAIAAVKKAWEGLHAALSSSFRFETQTRQFKTLVGSIGEARRHMADLKALGDTPPFSLDEFAAASRQMMVMSDGALGFKSSMELVGDAAAATGNNLETVGHAVGRLYAVVRDGQPIGRAALEMRNMGLLAPELVARLDEMQKSGASNIEIWNEITAALGKYKGAMKEVEDTGEGLASAIKARWDNAVRAFGDAFSSAAKGGMKDVLTVAKNLEEDGSLEVWAEDTVAALGKVAQVAKTVGGWLGTIWKTIKGYYESIGQGVGSFVGTLAGGGGLGDAWKNGVAGYKQGWVDAFDSDGAEAAQREERKEAKRKAREEKRRQEEAEAAKRQAAQEERLREQMAEAQAKITARAEMKAAQDAAKERDKLDRELHAKRMADLRAEIAAQKDAASALSKTASAAQSEFDRAFAMYRDPTRAAADIAEERDYAADLKRLHKDANRYGGKWRIDELSGLMAKGDTQGVADTLESWRKSKSFTPEVEAMVRASAAERTKTTVEDELRKIEANTADLGGKLEKLISMKG